jgi:hypothetical protein
MGSDTDDDAGRTMSWHEKELVAALKRLVAARERLAALEAQAGTTVSTGFDPDDEARLDELHAELVHARQKASGPFGRRWSDKVESLEMNERLVLDRLGVASYEEFRSQRVERPATTVELVDPVVLDFARRELQTAEAAFLDLQTLVVAEDEPEPDLELERGTTAEVAGEPSSDDSATQSA